MEKGNIRLRKFNKDMSNWKFTLVVIGITGVISIKLTPALYDFYKTSFPIPYTEEDIKNNSVFESEYQEIQEDGDWKILNFQNRELLKYIREEYALENVTKKDLENIKRLEIRGFLDPNLSDLKYFQNLEELCFYGMDINLEDIQYNQSLTKLTCENCTVSNTFYMPNNISELCFSLSKIEDEEFMIPYRATIIHINWTDFHNLNLKNPAILKKICFYSSSLLDLEWLKDCENLEEILLYNSVNVIHPYTLENMKSSTIIGLNEMCVAWMPTPLLEKLFAEKDTRILDRENNIAIAKKVSEKEKLNFIYLSKKIDTIAEVLARKEMSEEEKIYQIVVYLVEKYQYNKDTTDELSWHYNEFPITTALTSDEIICINYATMFSALANRLGIENYQAYNSNHAWNQVFINGEVRNFDVTNFDATESDYITDRGLGCYQLSAYSTYYDYTEEEREFYPNDEMCNTIEYIDEKTKDIGYVKPEELKINKFSCYASLTPFFIASALHVFQKQVNERIKEKRRERIIKKLRKKD